MYYVGIKMKSGRFSKEETAKLIELYTGSVAVEDICKILDRKKKSVLNKIYHLALKRK